jgi:hypothetical protein
VGPGAGRGADSACLGSALGLGVGSLIGAELLSVPVQPLLTSPASQLVRSWRRPARCQLHRDCGSNRAPSWQANEV